MTSRNYTSPYELNGRIPLAQAVPLVCSMCLPCSSAIFLPC